METTEASTTKKKAPTARVARKKKKVTSKKATKKASKNKGDTSMETQTQVEDVNPFADTSALQDVTSKNIEVVGESMANEKQEMELILPDDLTGVDLRTRVVDLRKQIDNSSFELGRVLYYIKINHQYQDWGFDTFKSYLEAEEPGSSSRLRHLIDLQEWFVEKIQDKKKIASIQELGWTKALQVKKGMELEAREDKQMEALDHWTDTAKEASLRSLTDAVKTEQVNKSLERKKDAEENPDHTKPVEADETFNLSFKLYAEQYKNVTDAIALAQKASGSDVKSNNLSLICLEYISSVDLGKNHEETRLKYLAKIEEQLNGKIVFIDNKTEEVIYGQELLDGDEEE